MKLENITGIVAIFSFCLNCCPASAQLQLAAHNDYTLTLNPSLRTDVISMNNNIDLDSSNDADQMTYLGFDYALGFDLKFKEDGPQVYMKLQRNGPYGYDAPVIVEHTVQTSSGAVERYEGSDLLPEFKEFWIDAAVGTTPVRLKTGSFALNIGHGLIGSYENYGVELYNVQENSSSWRFHYFFPDLIHNQRLGPVVSQEEDQAIDYEHSNVHLMATDVSFSVHEQGILQPYVSVLYDSTDGKRSNYFTAPTRKDILGTAGIAYDAAFGKVTLELEAARNFGKAKSSDDMYQDVEHQGYVLYEGVAVELGRFKPRSKMIYASGNRVTTDMVDNGDTTFGGGKNRAFSAYSPFNNNLADSLTQPTSVGPLVAMGAGWGLNYGIARPTTFSDGALFENIFIWSMGFEHQLTDKLTASIDGWFLRSVEQGVGTMDGSAFELSRNLGKEMDMMLAYTLNENVTLNLAGGYFWPGQYYKEERDDNDGSLFTPFVRGDGEADPAYQIEMYMTLSF